MSKSRSGKNNQEWEDVQSAAQMNSSDVRGGTNIQIRFSQVMLEESREEQIDSVHLSCFRVDLCQREGNYTSVDETHENIYVFQLG